MRFHSQNLNKKPGGRHGSKWRWGRCWLMWANGLLGFEWVFWSRGLSFQLGLGEHGHAVNVHFCIGFVNLYFYLNHFRLEQWLSDLTKRKDQKYGNGREIGIAWHEGYIFLSLWHDPMESRRADPQWWQMTISPRNLIFGRAKYENRVLRTVSVEVPMPEGSYPGVFKLEEETWKRPRWPWPKRRLCSVVEVEGGVLFPGKGENSWDCGEDAVDSFTSSVTTEHEAVGQFVTSLLADRYSHGGKMWRPEPKAVR